MPSAADRIEFGPPRADGALRSFGLALLVHALLIAALTWGLNWKRSNPDIAFEAELWSSTPQEAAPRLVEAPPPPPPPPVVTPPQVAPPPPTPDADIALEQDKKRKLAQQKEAEAQKQAKLKAEQAKAELQARKDKELKAKEELAKRKAAEEARKAEARKQDAKDDAKQKQADAAVARQRQEALNRMMGLAGATGGPDARGSAQKSGGPSASYGGKVRAKVKPNVVFTDDVVGNPTAEVEVRTAPDGTILSQRLVKSSGNKAWDDAVIKAIIRTGTMPRDVDGRVPTPMILEFRVRD